MKSPFMIFFVYGGHLKFAIINAHEQCFATSRTEIKNKMQWIVGDLNQLSVIPIFIRGLLAPHVTNYTTLTLSLSQH